MRLTFMQREELRQILQQKFVTKETLSRENVDNVLGLISDAMELEGLIANKALHESLLLRVIERREDERDAYRHALEAIARKLRSTPQEQPIEWQSIEQIAVEALALPDDTLLKARSYWEKRIVEAGRKLRKVAGNPNWIYSKELGDFNSAWHKLKKFHEENSTDNVIGPHALDEFIIFARLLRRIISDPQSSEQLRKDAEEQAEELETSVEMAVWAAGAEYW